MSSSSLVVPRKWKKKSDDEQPVYQIDHDNLRCAQVFAEKEDDSVTIKHLTFLVDFLRKLRVKDQKQLEGCVDLLVQRNELLDENEKLRRDNKELKRRMDRLAESFLGE